MQGTDIAAWKSKVRFVRGEYPFGPLKEHRNEEGRLHSINGPAYISPTQVIFYEDGRRHGPAVTNHGTINYFYKGVKVPRHYVLDPESVTVEEVMKNPNAEVRYAGMQIVGYDKFVGSESVTLLHETEEPERRLYRVAGVFAQDYTLLRLINSSPEPDGSYKVVWLNTPPEMKTCEEAVAWTFRKSAHEYKPAVET